MALPNRHTQNSPRQQQRRQRPSAHPQETPPINLEDLDSHWPPIEDFSNETPAQREERLVHEREAKRISDEIDAQLEVEKTERRKRRPDIRIILLGQAESGKSTVLRNFQLKYAPSTFHAEAEAWRAIIDLNLVRSVTFLLRLLDEDSCAPVAGSSNGSTSTAVDTSAPGTRSSSGSANSRGKSSGSSGIGMGFAGPGGEDDDARPLSPGGSTKLVPLNRLTDDLRRLHMSLSPLRSIEESLVRVISPDSPRDLAGGRTSSAALPTERAFEVSVRSGSRWKSLFSRSAGSAPASRATGKGHQELTNARRVIEACREDIIALWNHPAVRRGLDEQNVALEFQSGFFLDAVDRVAAPGYRPSPADILKARIQTFGVEEHLLRMETALTEGPSAMEHGQLWSIIDVGGSRALRAAWVPYFEDVDMLLFIAPVSAFNQTLSEDRRVNRLWDSFLLWKSLCMHKLLKKATFVLLLNKYDILDAKLRSGIKFRDFVTSYKDRPNNTKNVLEYLQGKFSGIYKQDPDNTRYLHVHVTCATDPKSTSDVLAKLREAIYTNNFRRAVLL